MSRKDYVAIAQAIRESRVGEDKLAAIRLVNLLTAYFQTTSPRFNTRRFEDEALPEGEKSWTS